MAAIASLPAPMTGAGPSSAGDRPHLLDPSHLGDHLDRLYRAAWSMTGSREDAEDLVQETYARVLARPRWLRRDDDLGYLLRVLRNTHISRLRAAGRRPAGVPFDDDGGREPADERSSWRPEAAVDAAAVVAAISQLPQPFREALVAVDVMGLSYAEAGRALRVREATITTRLHRARGRVAALIDPGVEDALGGEAR